MLTLYTDGSGPHGNGIGSATYVVVRDDCITHFRSIPLTQKCAKSAGCELTNNYAEYMSIISALECIVDYGHTEAQIFTDSQLVVKQFNREFQVKNINMAKLLREIRSLINTHNLRVTISWVPRSNKFIQEADLIGRQCIGGGVTISG